MEVPACSNTDKFGKARLVNTVSKNSLSKYGAFKEMTRGMLRRRDWDTVDIEKITDKYKKNYSDVPSSQGISPIGRADPYGPMNRFRPTPSPTMKSRYQPMPIQTRRAVSFQGQPRLPEIRISSPSDSLGQTAMVNREGAQYPLRQASKHVPSSTPSRSLTVAKPTPSRPFKKVIHTTHSLIESIREKCPDSCSKPPPRPPSPSPPSRRTDRLMLRPPFADIEPPRRPYSPLPLAGITGNVNMLTATYPDRSDGAIKERPSKTIKRTIVSNTKDKKIVTEEVSEIFDRPQGNQSKPSSLCQPCPSKSPTKQSRELSTYVAVPYNKQRSLPSVDNSTSPRQKKSFERNDLVFCPAYQPITENAGNLVVSCPSAEFQEKPSKVMRKKTIADRGSTRVVSQAVKEVYKTDRSCTAIEDPNAEGTNKAAVIKIIKLFLEIMSQLLKINSVKTL